MSFRPSTDHSANISRQRDVTSHRNTLEYNLRFSSFSRSLFLASLKFSKLPDRPSIIFARDRDSVDATRHFALNFVSICASRPPYITSREQRCSTRVSNLAASSIGADVSRHTSFRNYRAFYTNRTTVCIGPSRKFQRRNFSRHRVEREKYASITRLTHSYLSSPHSSVSLFSELSNRKPRANKSPASRFIEIGIVCTIVELSTIRE